MSSSHDLRPHAGLGVPLLATQPMAQGRANGLKDLVLLRAQSHSSIVHRARITTYAPITARGSPPQPSLVLAQEVEYEVLSPREGNPAVAFEDDGQCLRARVQLPLGTDFYGLGLHAGRLRCNGRSFQLWNTDAWCYGEESPALYQSHPFVLALLPGGQARGILAASHRRGLVQVADDGVEFAFEEEAFDLHLLEADEPEQVLRALAALIGTPALPPLWSLGYHQSRWSYESAHEVRELAQRLRAERIPCDAIWMDIDFMDRQRVFTWNRERFPDPAGLADELHAKAFHWVAILDPGVVTDPTDKTCASGLAGEHFVLDARGAPARGRVWPGLCYFPDFSRAESRAWWAQLAADFVTEAKLDGLWTDMNEPSVFRVPSKTLPTSARHRGEGGGDHARFHNLYGQWMAEATRQGLQAARPQKRPFVLTRSNHLSGARHAATWTGDNQSRWEDLAWAIPMVLNLGLSGQPVCGPDLGGFYGDPSAELFVRWFELGAYLPFCRGHGEKTSCRKEPWAFGPAALAQVRAALERRMRLLPTLYTLFHEAAHTGLPIARPLFLADPSDARLRAVDDAFLLGADLLIAPVVRSGVRRRRCVLPRSSAGWYLHAAQGWPSLEPELELEAPLGITPVLARAGSIVVEAPTRLSTAEQPQELHWHIYLDAQREARGRLYEDAGDGYGYLQGEARELELSARWDGNKLELTTTARGHYAPAYSTQRVFVYGTDVQRREFLVEQSSPMRVSLPASAGKIDC